MIPSVLSQQLRQGVEDFLKTTFPVSTPFFHGIVDLLLSEDDGVFKGPFLSIQLHFRYGGGRDAPFPNIKIDFTPYLHQEKAFERLSGLKSKSTIVATGTGSGKTECFLYPILEDLINFKHDYPEAKAYFLYRGKESLMIKGIHCIPCEEFLLQLKPEYRESGKKP